MAKMKSLLVLMIILSYSIANAYSPFQFLRFSESARAAALAGCFVSMPGDASAVVFNPASIATVEDKTFSVTFLKHILDINSGLVTYIKPIEDMGVIAGAVSFINYGSFVYADENANRGGTFGANDMFISGSYANELDSNLYYGVSAKILFINLEKATSFAFAVDAGLIYLIPDKRTNIGLSILHAGTQITTLEGKTESLPLDIRLGINHRLRGLPLLVNFSFHHLADKTNNFFDKLLGFSLAGELYIGKYVQVRLGYDNQIRRLASADTDKKLSGFTGGIGIQTKDFNLDYGAAQDGTAALLHRFSLGFGL